MIRSHWLFLLATLLTQALPAQQLSWQVPPTPLTPSLIWYLGMAPFPDYNRDGYVDMLQLAYLNMITFPQAVQIVSGRDGSILWSSLQPATGRMAYAGDVNGDGLPDVALRKGNSGSYWVEIWSPSTNTMLWQQFGSYIYDYGHAMLGDIDVNGDGLSDFLVTTSENLSSDVFVYDSWGMLLYTVPCLSQGRIAYSLCNMHDVNGDGRDDFLIGCNDTGNRGVLVLISGATGAVLRLSYGLAWGDQMTDHVSNVGDMDGDGVSDYAGFPSHSTWSGLTAVFSGATGNMIHHWYDFAESVIVGQDMDLDGVPDIVLGSDAYISQNVYGSTRALSGRDGTLLWRVDNFRPPPGSQYSNGSSGYARYAAGLGTQPGNAYPSIAWMDTEWFGSVTFNGRIRAYNTERAGQGPITGAPCSSTGQNPQIGARQTASGARITIAKGPPAAVGFLNLALAGQTSYGGMPLPIDLTAVGLVGCNAYVGPEAAYWRILGATSIDRGYAAADFNVQLTASGLGTAIVAQWLVFDPATLGYAATAKHELRAQ